MRLRSIFGVLGRRHGLTALSVLVAIALVPLLVTTSLRLVMLPWIVHAEYAIGRVPADPLGLAGAERTRLALLGLDSIEPGSRGMDILREARLADGQPAFTEREIVHMQDVRDLVGALLAYQLWASVALVALAAVLALRRPTRMVVPRGLRIGVLAGIGTTAVIGIAMLAAWDWFFVRFHKLFFEGSSWRFRDGTTLRRVYPDEFWMGVGAWLVLIAVLLALLVWFGAGAWLRRTRAPDAATRELLPSGEAPML